MFWNQDFFGEMRKMQIEMDRLFERAFGQETAPMLTYGKGNHGNDKGKDLAWRTPRTDIYETEGSVIATFELPGVDKKDIQLNVTDRAVEVKVEKLQEKKDKDSYSYSQSSFYRCMPMPGSVSADKAKAQYKDGMLRVEIPKAEGSKGSRILIE